MLKKKKMYANDSTSIFCMFSVINVMCRLAEGLTGRNFYKHSKIVIVTYKNKIINNAQLKYIITILKCMKCIS